MLLDLEEFDALLSHCVIFHLSCNKVADFGVSAQLTRTISRRKVSFFIFRIPFS